MIILKYLFKHKTTNKEKVVHCSMNQINEVTKELNEQGYKRIYKVNLIGFDNLGRSIKK